MLKLMISLLVVILIASLASANSPHSERGNTCSAEAAFNLLEPGGPSFEGQLGYTGSDWYTLTITVDGLYTVESSRGSMYSTDQTRLWLFQGDCESDDLTEIAFDTDTGLGNFGMIEAVDLAAGDYYVKIDYDNSAYGDPGLYVLAASVYTPPVFCAEAMDGECNDTGGGVTGHGTDVFTRCGNGGGPVDFYGFVVPVGESFTATLDAFFSDYDAHMQIVDSCTGPFECLAYSRTGVNGSAELTYENTGTETEHVYLGIQGDVLYHWISYSLSVVCSSGVVSDKTTTMSAVKAMYR